MAGLSDAADHENASCAIAESTLPDFGYTPEDIRQICGLIQATELPQAPHNLLAEIIADADLDYLGREDFFTIGEKLFEEFSFFKVVNTRDEWNRLQVRFLEKHHFFTQTALMLRQAKKEEHLEMIKESLQRAL